MAAPEMEIPANLMSVGPESKIKILIVDSSPQDVELIRSAIARDGIQILTAANAEAALRVFVDAGPRIILCDAALSGLDGSDLMERMLARDPAIDFILMSAAYSNESAMNEIRRGARDVLAKPIELDKLRECIQILIAEAEARSRTLNLERGLLEVYQFEGMIGRSPQMLEVFAKIRRIAPHFASVLLTGPTGSGKELVARALHRLRAEGPFAVCNCSALVESLLETELFGSVRGAYTGAAQDRQGIFEFANKGTVFLDEIGELSLPAQAKLLRVLQSREVQRVGSPVTYKVDVRVIAATHRNLRKMVAAGQFREDLFYRLSAVEISVPPLVQRREDVPLLQRHFLEKYSKLYGKRISGITRRAQMRLAMHTWPGNIRELENVISGSCIMATGQLIDLPDLPENLRSTAKNSTGERNGLVTLEAVQHRYVKEVLQYVRGNKARAASILGVGRSTIYEMLNRMDERSGANSLQGGTQ